MKHNYDELYDYYENMNDAHDFDYALEALENDTRNEQLLLEIVDALQDEQMLRDMSTALIKDMFAYYVKHK